MRVDAVARAMASTPGHRETPEDRRDGSYRPASAGRQGRSERSPWEEAGWKQQARFRRVQDPEEAKAQESNAAQTGFAGGRYAD